MLGDFGFVLNPKETLMNQGTPTEIAAMISELNDPELRSLIEIMAETPMTKELPGIHYSEIFDAIIYHFRVLNNRYTR